ncbi:type II toxin-antitoxin system RelE/ParE family toxin [bacterium]|nr:type II toxin-antitoxin system RelE/ParE family toxin [bacterium]
MSLPVVLRPEARAEYDEAVDWFEQRRAGSGAPFIRAVKQTLDLIGAQPKVHRAVLGDVRRAPVSGFPYYRIIYRERDTDVEVLAVFHTSRDPAVWQGRA